jgi:hypothetical protein
LGADSSVPTLAKHPPEQKRQLPEDTVRPGIALVDVEGLLYMLQRLVQRGYVRCFEEDAAGVGPGHVRMGAGIMVKRHSTAEITQCLGQIVPRQTAPPIVTKQDKIVCSHIRGLLALGEITASALELAWQGRDDGSGDLILDDEDFLEFAVVALAPQR